MFRIVPARGRFPSIKPSASSQNLPTLSLSCVITRPHDAQECLKAIPAKPVSFVRYASRASGVVLSGGCVHGTSLIDSHFGHLICFCNSCCSGSQRRFVSRRKLRTSLG